MTHIRASATTRRLSAFAFAAGFLTATAFAACAGPRYGAAPPDFVVAESNYGHGTVTGPVRPGGRGGWQVRLPGGTWIDCVRSCSDTLRRQTVDIWENLGRDVPDNGRGYFSRSWLF